MKQSLSYITRRFVIALCFQLVVPQPTNEDGKNPIVKTNVISSTSKVNLIGKSATAKPVTSPKISQVKLSTSKPNMISEKNQQVKLTTSKPFDKENLIGTQQLKKSYNAAKPLNRANLNRTKVEELKSANEESVNNATLTSTPGPDKLFVANKINDGIKQAKEEAYKQLMILEEDKRVIHQELEQVILNASQKLPKPNMEIAK